MTVLYTIPCGEEQKPGDDAETELVMAVFQERSVAGENRHGYDVHNGQDDEGKHHGKYATILNM